MISSTRQAIACIFVIIIVAIVAHAQLTPAKEPGGTISGKATLNGRAVAGVHIILRENDQNNYRRRAVRTYKAVTDDEGNYRIVDVAPGDYRILAMAPAFVAENETDRERILIVRNGETIEHFDFTLVRGGVITGKVVDADGQPVVEEPVYAVNTQDGRFFYSQYGSSTDDRGVYRLFGLRPGTYKVAAGRDEDSFMSRTVRTYKQTYYPSALDLAQATVVEVAEGSETRDIDIVFGRTVTTYTVKGRVVDGETGQPVANVAYGLTRYDQRGSSSRGWGDRTNPRGEFKIQNLSPGTYSISISPAADSDWRVEDTRFEIVDHDVTDLVFKTIRSGSISGVVVLEGVDDKTAREQLSRMTIIGYTEGGPGQSPSMSARVKEDGSFQVRGLAAGTVFFYLQSSSSVRIDHVERDGGIEPRGALVREREHVTGVRIIAQLGNATLRGKIDVENGTLASDAQFYVWARRVGEEPGGMYSGLNVRSQVDERGQFVIEGLTPGAYDLNAGVFFPATKIRYEARKQVVVTATPASDVNITIDLSSTPIKQP